MCVIDESENVARTFIYFFAEINAGRLNFVFNRIVSKYTLVGSIIN